MRRKQKPPHRCFIKMVLLASESPRRFELFSRLGIPFEVKSEKVQELEHPEDGCSCSLLPQLNARLKAAAVSRMYPDAVVIGADTAIVFEDRLIGKPRDLEDARDTLRSLSGKKHEVITGIAVICKNSAFERCWSEVSAVCFKNLSDEVIEKYLNLVNVLDKAGSYAIQEHGELIISEISGDMDNIIGLPLDKLRLTLTELAVC